MIKRVLFIGDNHIDDFQPIGRVDDYFKTGQDELLESLQIGRNEKVDAVVFLGDIFHRMEPSGQVRNSVLRLLMSDENGKPWPFEKYITVGNHDIRHNPANLERSTLGTLIQTGVLKYVDVATHLGIGFVHFAPHVCEQLGAGMLQEIQSRYEEPIYIWAMHASVTPGKYFGDHIQIEDVVVNDPCKLLVCGHIHMPMRHLRTDKVLFMNPGSIGRTALRKEHVDRMPEVMLVEYETDDGTYKIGMQALECCQPADEIFSVQAADNRKRQKADTQKYIRQLSALSVLNEDINKYDALRASGESKSLEPSVIDLAVSALRAAGENIETVD